MPRTRHPYPSDLTDQEWNLLQPLLASPQRRGHPPKWRARRLAEAVFYLLRSGCAWRMLPREYPPWHRPCTTTSAGGAWTVGSGERTTTPSASPVENDTSWWTRTGSSWPRACMVPTPPGPGRRTTPALAEGLGG